MTFQPKTTKFEVEDLNSLALIIRVKPKKIILD
jgi:hypothetical protein